MKIEIIFLYFLYCFKNVSTTTSNEIEMIVDVINSYEKPTSVLAHVCWNIRMKTELMVKLRNASKPRTIQFFYKDLIVKGYTRREHMLFVVDVTCPRAKKILIQANTSKLFSNPYRWLILGGQDLKESMLEIENLRILTDSEVMISQNTGNIFTLNIIYKFMQNDIWHIEFFGNWTPSSGLYKLEAMKTSNAMRRIDFQKRPLTTTMIALDNRTMDNLYDLVDIETDTLTKANYRHTETLYDFMNATRINKFTNTWGYYVNGSWNGMIGHFVTGEADIAATVIYMTVQRLDVIEYLAHPTDLKASFVFREPPLSYHSNLFLLPFTTIVWCCIGVFILVLVVIGYADAYWEKVKPTKEESVDPTAVRANVGDIAVLIISAMCQQGSTIELKGTVGRLITFFLFLTFLFLYTSYSASIVALLQASSDHIRTLSDLYNSKLELGLEGLAYQIYFFSIATEPIRKAIFENKIAPPGRKPNYFDVEEGVRKLQTKPFAFHMNKQVGYRLINKYFKEHEKCGLQEITFLDDLKPFLICPKASPYVEMFKIGLQRAIEHGVLNRINKMIYATKPICSARGGNFISVTIIDFYPVLVVFAYGVLLSLFFLIMEILIHRRQKLQRKNTHIVQSDID